MAAAFDWLELFLDGPEGFRRVFGTVLTGRGPEFSDVAGMERGGRCSVYYADPIRSDRKGVCEKNHVELRKIVPKGTSLDGLGVRTLLPAEVETTPGLAARLAAERDALAAGTAGE